MTITLRDGSTTQDPRLNRLVEFDERSKNFPVRELLPPKAPLISRTWSAGTILDQLAEGSCVGNAFAKDAASYPVPVGGITETTAVALYRLAQKLDQFPDDVPYEGTSTLGGVKAYQQMGFATSYRWGFNVDDVLATLSNLGPVIIGINWYESMYDTLPNGLVEVSGNLAGGHCICLTGHWLGKMFRGEAKPRHVVEWTNSWGPSYGLNGRGYIAPEDLDVLLRQQGECCVPMGRQFPKSHA